MFNKYKLLSLLFILTFQTATCLECYSGVCTKNCKVSQVMGKETCGEGMKCVSKIIFKDNDEDLKQIDQIRRFCGNLPLGCNKENSFNQLSIICACTDHDLCNAHTWTTSGLAPLHFNPSVLFITLGIFYSVCN